MSPSPATVSYSPEFLTFWNAFPRTHGKLGSKAEAYRIWQRLRDRPPVSDLIAAAQAQATEKTAAARNGTFAPPFKHVCRWLKGREWENEVEVQARRMAV